MQLDFLMKNFDFEKISFSFFISFNLTPAAKPFEALQVVNVKKKRLCVFL